MFKALEYIRIRMTVCTLYLVESLLPNHPLGTITGYSVLMIEMKEA